MTSGRVDRVVIPIYIFKNGNDEHLCPELLHADVTSKMVQNATGFHVEVLNTLREYTLIILINLFSFRRYNYCLTKLLQ